MPYIQGTLTGHYEMFEKIKDYAGGYPTIGTPAYSGTGDGTLDLFDAYPKCPSETWTLNCTTPGGDGVAIFSVTGSVSGAQSSATAGTAYDNGFIEFTITGGAADFVSSDNWTIALTEGVLTTAGIAHQILEYGSTTGQYDATTLDYYCHYKAPGLTVVPVYTGTGNGTITGITRYPYTTLTAESWEIEATSATNFTVTGSISGSQAAATAGTIYDNGKIRFLITAGGTAFVATDKFIIGVPQEIFYSIVAYQDEFADFYNLRISGATGFLAGQETDLGLQPGATGGKAIPMYNQTIDYTLVVNAQRIVFDCQVETKIMQFYLGYLFPYGTPLQAPYPMCAGGMHTSGGSVRYDGTFTFPFATSSNFYFRQPSGGWTVAEIWPYSSIFINGSSRNIRTTEGNYPLLPIVVWDSGNDEQYGELDGVKFVSGFNIAVGDTVDIGGDTYLVASNYGRTGFDDYCAILLD